MVDNRSSLDRGQERPERTLSMSTAGMRNYLRTSILYTLFVGSSINANIAGYLSTLIGFWFVRKCISSTVHARSRPNHALWLWWYQHVVDKDIFYSRPPCTLARFVYWHCQDTDVVWYDGYDRISKVIADILARASATIIMAYCGRSLANSYHHFATVMCFNRCSAAGGCHGDVMAWQSISPNLQGARALFYYCDMTLSQEF